ncbi:MAG: 2-amino-4-hydroxy-6-hydroxymethyldihydropteridine diphosphokinase [Candidatus Omnitrophica bacterium]|nr:2-amino-4-hydroxy-6-hydroxymethyldihydropteridine diphosphokinase [Candidatus Omnitrophota bacterium]
MAIVFIAFGSNSGNRRNYISQALNSMEELGIELLQVSSFHETEPVGGPSGQMKYLNGVAKVKTSLTPVLFLDRLQQIEKNLGRERSVPDAPRTIDLDILLYDDLKVQTDRLTIPHPRMWQRTFVLNPLEEIAPEIVEGGP